MLVDSARQAAVEKLGAELVRVVSKLVA
jgi:hypothetical protein